MGMANRAGLALLVLVAPAAASADDPLAGVSDMVRELRYEDALARIEAIRVAPGTAAATRLRALELAAVAHLGLGHSADAREAFTELLTLDPGAELTLGRPSPRIVELFQAVRASLGEGEPDGGLTTTLTRAGTSIVAEARPDGESAITRVVFRAQRGARSTDVEGSDGPPWRAPIPATGPDDLARLSVVARGFAPSGALAAVSPPVRLGADGRVTVAPEREDPTPIVDRGDPEETRPRRGIATRWWFWGAIGVVVVGGTVTAIALATSGGDAARPGDLGSFRLTPSE